MENKKLKQYFRVSKKERNKKRAIFKKLGIKKDDKVELVLCFQSKSDA